MAHRDTPVTRWLRGARGSMSQADLVADLVAVTGWRLPRENYSKYETGALNPEPTTLARFEAYWAAKGVAGPDLTPEPPPPAPALGADALLDTMARMLEATVQALTDVRLELAQARRDAAEQREETATLIGGLSAQLAELRDLAGRPAGSAGRAS